MPDYNVEAELKDIILTAGDTINESFDVYKYNNVTKVWDLYDITGKQLDIHVKDSAGTIIKDWSSVGDVPAITIAGTSFNIYDLAPITSPGRYLYDIQLTDGSEISTIRKGMLIVQKETT
jgi:hypothetical protein